MVSGKENQTNNTRETVGGGGMVVVVWWWYGGSGMVVVARYRTEKMMETPGFWCMCVRVVSNNKVLN